MTALKRKPVHSGIDPTILHELRHQTLSGTVPVYLQILELFVSRTEDGLKRLVASHLQGDLVAVVKIAHNLKGNGLSVGAQLFSEIAVQLEALGQSQRQSPGTKAIDAKTAAKLVDELAQEFLVCQTYLIEEINRVRAETES